MIASLVVVAAALLTVWVFVSMLRAGETPPWPSPPDDVGETYHSAAGRVVLRVLDDVSYMVARYDASGDLSFSIVSHDLDDARFEFDVEVAAARGET